MTKMYEREFVNESRKKFQIKENKENNENFFASICGFISVKN